MQYIQSIFAALEAFQKANDADSVHNDQYRTALFNNLVDRLALAIPGSTKKQIVDMIQACCDSNLMDQACAWQNPVPWPELYDQRDWQEAADVWLTRYRNAANQPAKQLGYIRVVMTEFRHPEFIKLIADKI